MVPYLYTLVDMIGTDYLAVHATRVARQSGRVRAHEVPDPIPAYVNENRWLVDCDCGSGARVDPDAGVACCFGCGAVHTRVVMPAERAEIEAILIARRSPFARGWRDRDKAETVADLRKENTSGAVAIVAEAKERD